MTISSVEQAVTEDISNPGVSIQTEEVKVETPNIPNDIFQRFERESVITDAITNNMNIFQINSVVNKVKEKFNPLHENLKNKSKIFIFGAGGTTSWFLPKLLKIYNDAFHKVPNLRYDLNIVLVDHDQV